MSVGKEHLLVESEKENMSDKMTFCGVPGCTKCGSNNERMSIADEEGYQRGVAGSVEMLCSLRNAERSSGNSLGVIVLESAIRNVKGLIVAKQEASDQVERKGEGRMEVASKGFSGNTAEAVSAGSLRTDFPMKCLVAGCENRKHQGAFVGELCVPCHTFLTTGSGAFSQLYRNGVALHEACAVFDRVTGLILSVSEDAQKALLKLVAERFPQHQDGPLASSDTHPQGKNT
jgi:hypothetical protein